MWPLLAKQETDLQHTLVAKGKKKTWIDPTITCCSDYTHWGPKNLSPEEGGETRVCLWWTRTPDCSVPAGRDTRH